MVSGAAAAAEAMRNACGSVMLGAIVTVIGAVLFAVMTMIPAMIALFSFEVPEWRPMIRNRFASDHGLGALPSGATAPKAMAYPRRAASGAPVLARVS